jgi:SET domain-containing protein
MIRLVRHKAMNKKRRALPCINSKYARYRLRAARSGIHRFGVYALETIPAGRIVIEYTGRRMSWAKASRVPFEKSIYIANLKRGYAVDGRIGGSGAEYVNHSCEPNLKPKRAAGHLFFCSRRKIRPGEELTMDYKYSIKLRRIPCRCGARNCRKTFMMEFRK